MTEETINLQKGLQSWYDFDPDYFDNQTNKLQDKSGYGRKAEAQGGVTVGGGDAPESFDSSALDGTDDGFTVNELTSEATDGFAAVAFLRDEGTQNDYLSASPFNSPGFSMGTENASNTVTLRLQDDAGTNVVADGDVVSQGEWHLIGADYDGSKGRTFLDGEFSGVTDFSSLGTISEMGSQASIGYRDATDSQYVNGEIAFAATWNRSLTDAEWAYLNEMTAPKRSKL